MLDALPRQAGNAQTNQLVTSPMKNRLDHDLISAMLCDTPGSLAALISQGDPNNVAE
jgi:hypothetical protein